MGAARPAGPARPPTEFLAAVLAAEATFVAEQLSTVVRAATPRRTRATRTTTRPDGRVVTVVTERVEFGWRAAAWLLECKDQESFGPDRAEVVRLRREVAELRPLLARQLGDGKTA